MLENVSEEPQVRVFETMESAGGFVDDVWRHFFCACCSLAQEDREVRRWEQEVAMGDGLDGLEGEEGGRGVVGETGVGEEGERLLGEERSRG